MHHYEKAGAYNVLQNNEKGKPKWILKKSQIVFAKTKITEK